MVPEIYVQFYCVMINLTNCKHDAQNKTSLDILQICQIFFLICQISTLFMLI
jgi:hypothetical protein